MPSDSQLTLIHTIPVTEYSKGNSATARLRASFSSHENSIVQETVTSEYETGFNVDPVSVNLFADPSVATSLKKFYGNTVMRGPKNPAGSGFPAAGEGAGGVNLDYEESAPDIRTTGPTPEGEAAPGSAGSTIHSSGLGPNVNIHGTLGAGGDRAQVDAAPVSVTPFEGTGDKSPNDSIVYNTGGNIPAGAMGDSEETVTG